MEHELEKARNPKLTLSTFEQIPGLKTNFHKSELFCFDEARDEANFGSGKGQFPVNYLGILIRYWRLRNAE
jgi:hypothetical protein